MMLRRWAATAMLAVTAAACGGDGQGLATSDADSTIAEEAPLVMATTSIWADVVHNTACQGMARVESLIPLGADAHGFEPSLADRARLQEAALIVANGLQLEEAVAPAVESAAADGIPVFTVADHLTLDADAGAHADDDHADDAGAHADDDHADDAGAHADDGQADDAGAHADDDHGHEHPAGDPHVWFDPTVVSATVAELGEALVAEVGLDADRVAACVEEYRQQLDQLDADVRRLVDQIPPEERLLVTNHAALGHFARRYGFEIVGTVIPSSSTMAETNPAALEELAGAIEEAGVPVIFTESSASAPDAEALARRLGDIEVIELPTDSLGADDSGAGSYLELLMTTAQRVVDGLTGA